MYVADDVAVDGAAGPGGINAAGDHGQKPVDDVYAEELAAGAVEDVAVALDAGPLGLPSLLHAGSPGKADAAGDKGEQRA